jgi:hypothetical protein
MCEISIFSFCAFPEKFCQFIKKLLFLFKNDENGLTKIALAAGVKIFKCCFA